MADAERETSLSDDSTSNLESSLQSCTAHRARILQMLQEDPDNANLIELRDQLTNAINQLQGTKTMVQRAQRGAGGGLTGLASAAASAGPSHSSRKNKPQRCSVCGGIGHKSRTCSMAQQHPAQQQMQPWQTQYMPGAFGPPGMAPPNYPGAYVMTQGQPGQMAAPHKGMPGSMPMGGVDGSMMHPESGMMQQHSQQHEAPGMSMAGQIHPEQQQHMGAVEVMGAPGNGVPPMAMAIEAQGRPGMMPGMMMMSGSAAMMPSAMAQSLSQPLSEAPTVAGYRAADELPVPDAPAAREEARAVLASNDTEADAKENAGERGVGAGGDDESTQLMG